MSKLHELHESLRPFNALAAAPPEPMWLVHGDEKDTRPRHDLQQHQQHKR